MQRIHLLLSGGGFRATLFHLGVLRFLYERRAESQEQDKSVLHLVDLTVGVSGGSLTACHYVANTARYLGYFKDAAQDLIDFCKTTDLRRLVLVNKESVPAILRRKLFEETLLEATPDSPQLVVLGTSYRTGDCIAFRKSGISQWAFDTASSRLKCNFSTDDAGICLTKLIQASAAFPPFFSPLKIKPELFTSKPPVMKLGTLMDDEVADGGIRDNLGYEWYTAANETNPGVQVLISDAGQAFDWDATSRLAQGASVWGQRLLRTTDIQMRRLGQSDLADGKRIFPNSHYVGFVDAQKLQATENSTNALWNKPLPRGVAQVTSKMSTDLTKVGDAQCYAIIRLGYDLASVKLGNEFPAYNTASQSDNFWKELFPEGKARRLLGEDDKESLQYLVYNEEVPRIKGWNDLWNHIPWSKLQKIIVASLLIIIPIPFTIGSYHLCMAAYSWMGSLWTGTNEFDYEQFIKLTNERDWESACQSVLNAYVTVRGQLLDRRGAIVKIELAGRKKICLVDTQDDPRSENLPNDPKPDRPYYVVLRGQITSFDTNSITLINGKLLDTLDERPAAW